MAIGKKQDERWSELRASRDMLEPHSRSLKRQQFAICGPAYGDGTVEGAPVPDEPENHAQNFLRMFVGEVGQSAPRCSISSNGQEWPLERAGVLEAACNQAAEQNGLLAQDRIAATDYAMRHCTSVCSLGPVEGYYGEKDAPWNVKDQRLSFDDYLWDSTVTNRALGQWEGHRVVRQIDEVIEKAEYDKSWNIEYLQEIKDQLGRDPRERDQQGSVRTVRRNELVYWVMWERCGRVNQKRSPRDGFNGCLHYVLEDTMPAPRNSETPLRESQDWFGHPSGPYAHGGSMWIGDLPIVLSPLVGSASQAFWVNVMAKALMVANAQYKRIFATCDEDVRGQLTNSENGGVIVLKQVEDLRKLLVPLEVGGAPVELINAFAMAMESLQRNSGLYQNREGQVQSDATATAIIDAQQGFDETKSFLTSGFRDFQKQRFEKWAFWFDLSPKVLSRVGPLPQDVQMAMAQRTGGKPEPFFELRGGLSPGTKWSALDHNMLDLRISAFSGRPRNEQTMAADVQFLMAGLQFLMGLGPAALAVDVDKFMRILARSRNMPEAMELVDSKILYPLLAQMMQMQQAPPKPQPQQVKQRAQLGGSGGAAGARPIAAPKAGGAKSQGARPAQPAKPQAATKPAMAGAKR